MDRVKRCDCVVSFALTHTDTQYDLLEREKIVQKKIQPQKNEQGEQHPKQRRKKN